MSTAWIIFIVTSVSVAAFLSGRDSHGSLSGVALRSATILPLVMLLLPLACLVCLLLFLIVSRSVELTWKSFIRRRSRSRAEYLPKGGVKKVAVIGAGASGITAAKEALQAGFDVVVFEQTGDIGGNWVFREKDCHASVYRSTVINTSKQLMSYSDYPMSTETPTYPHHTQIIQYFVKYAKHFDVMRHIQFHTKVVEVTPLDSQRWRVFFQKTGEDDGGAPEAEYAKVREDEGQGLLDGVQFEDFDAVMVCNGHHSVPLWPNFPGQDTFKGHMIHSHSYKDVTSCDKGFDFREKRVLVVGIGNSGADVSTEISRFSKELYLSTRSGAWVVPKYVGGVATDHAWQPIRLVMALLPEFFVKSTLGMKIQASVYENLVQTAQGDMVSWGLRPSMHINQAHVTINQDLLHRIGLGSIKTRGNIREIHDDGVTFESGEHVALDAIVFCTGYLTRFPFLSKSLQPVDNENNVRLYKHIFNPNHASTLAFIGFIQPIGAIMPIAEIQSRWVVQVFKGDRGLPSAAEMTVLIDTHLKQLWKQFLRRARHAIEVEYYPVMEDVAEEIGCVPRLWNPNNWKVLKELLFSPASWSFTYRLQGPGAWTGAANALREAFCQIGQHP